MPRCRRDLLALAGALALAGCTAPQLSDDDGGDDPTADEPPADEPDEEFDWDERSVTPTVSFPETRPDLDDDVLLALAEGQAAFALDLFEELTAERSPTENLVVSPLSVSLALAMTYAGARTTTAESMADALRFGPEGEDVHHGFGSLQNELDARDREGHSPDEEDAYAVEVRLANRLWGREDGEFRREFLDLVEAHYGGGLETVDFADTEATLERINGWVAEQTRDLIDELLGRQHISPNTVLVLTNALFFHGDWNKPFPEGDTGSHEFTALDGSTSTVDMMHQPRETFSYAELGGHQVVELPYVGRDLSMVLVLPADGAFESFTGELSTARLWRLLDELETTPLSVSVPKFETETAVELPETLDALGMGEAFSGDADFSGMIEGGGIWIDEVVHESTIEVDERSTRAAAATAVGMEESLPPEPEAEFVADRPFLYFIRDRHTETILFVGRVVDGDPLA